MTSGQVEHQLQKLREVQPVPDQCLVYRTSMATALLDRASQACGKRHSDPEAAPTTSAGDRHEHHPPPTAPTPSEPTAAAMRGWPGTYQIAREKPANRLTCKAPTRVGPSRRDRRRALVPVDKIGFHRPDSGQLGQSTTLRRGSSRHLVSPGLPRHQWQWHPGFMASGHRQRHRGPLELHQGLRPGGYGHEHHGANGT